MLLYRYWLAAGCAIALSTAGAAQTPVTFIQPESIGACTSIAAADFNGDGNLDVACALNTVNIWLGDGQGHFHETSQQLPYANAQLVTGDFNGDGITDLVVATTNLLASSSQIVFLAGNGDGTFGTQVTIADQEATALATIRRSPNGPLDLVATLLTDPLAPGSVEIFPGNGDGTFQSPFSVNIFSSTNIVVADFNGDGISDIASCGALNATRPRLQVALGNAEGGFSAPIDTIMALVEPFAAADFTGDGILDVAWTDGQNIFVLAGNGDGTFSPGPTRATKTGQVLLAADLNGDGLPDLVMAGMAVALNQGGGAFGPSEWYQNPSGNSGVAGDFRHLEMPDVIVAGDYYANDGTGNFREPRSYPAVCKECPAYVTTGDFNNDGNLDAVVATLTQVRVYFGTGGGNFTGYEQTTVTLPAKDAISAVAAADFNGDGKLDLALGCEQNVATQGEVVILPGNGDGTFGAPMVAYSGFGVTALAVADFNGDGRMDLAIGTKFGVVVMLGNGAGGFTTSQAFKSTLTNISLVVADFNGDGIPDFATNANVYLGNGDGTFRLSYTLPESWNQVMTGDANGDGIPDLMTWDALTETIDYWPGIGDGTFGVPLTVSTLSPEMTLVADLNGDGISDIVTPTGNDYTSLTLYLGNGNGTFTPETINNLATPQFELMAAGQFNTLSLADLLYVSGTGQLLVLINSTR